MKKLNKKWLSFFSIIATIGVLVLMFSISQPLKRTVADGGAVGGASSNHPSGGGGGVGISSGDWKSNGRMAYRVYFAPNTLDFNQSNSTYSTFTTSKDGVDTYSNLEKYAQIAIYDEKSWEGADTSGDVIHTWTRTSGTNGEVAIKADLQDVFGVFSSSSASGLSALDLNTGSFTYDEFKNYFSVLNVSRDNIKHALDGYRSWLSSSSLTSTERSVYNDLIAIAQPDVNGDYKGLDDLMIICEPVFLSQIGGGNEYFSVSLGDWGYDYNFDGNYGGGIHSTMNDTGAYLIQSRIEGRLNMLWADFTYNGTQFNATNRWYGFAYYSSLPFPSSKVGIGVNLNIQYSGDLVRNNMSGANTDISLSETMTSPSQEDDNANGKSTSFVGDDRYAKALQSWDGVAGSSTAQSHTKSALFMTGWTWANVAYAGDGSPNSWIPWDGAWKYQAVDNLKQMVDTSMTGRITGSDTDYVLGVFGHMTADTIDNIVDKDMLISSVLSTTLNVQDNCVGDYSMFFGDASAMQSLEDYVKSNIKTTIKETALTADTDGYAFGSTVTTQPYMNSPDITSDFTNRLAGAFNAGGNLRVTSSDPLGSISPEVNDDGTIKGQETPEAVQESLARIQGATVFANPVNISQPTRTDQVTVKPNSKITVAITTMEKENKLTNYLASTRVASTGGTDSVGSFEFADLGRTYENEHPVQAPSVWTLNDVTTGTIGSGDGDQEVSFLLVWKNSDMTNGTYSFENNVGDGATEVTTKIAEYMTNNHQTMSDEKSYGMIGNAFKAVTGVTPLTSVCIGDNSDIDVPLRLGSVFDASDKLSGLSALVITVSGEGNVYTETGGNLPADYLNIIAPSSWGTKSNSPVYNWTYTKRDWDGTERDWEVEDYLSGDLWNFGHEDLLYYNEDKGNFGTPDDDDKWFGYGERAYMSYAFILPRSLWGDTPTVADYIGDGMKSRYQDFAERMKFPVGDYSKDGTTCSVGANVEKVYPVTKHDTHKFKCSVEWETRRKRHHHGDSWWEYTTHNSSTYRTYSISNTMDKHTAMNKGVASVSSGEAHTLYWDNQDSSRDTDFTYASTIRDQSNDVLSLYPEVRMLMQYASGDDISSIDDVETVDNLYVMGEKLRNFHPIAMRGITIGNNDQFSGQFTSNTIATDSRAKALQVDGLPIIYAGGNLNLHVDGIEDKIKLVSYAIDFDDDTRDSNRYLRFNSSNSSYKPDKEHEDFVNGVLKNLGVDVTLDINEDESGNNTKYRYHNFNTMMSQFDVENTQTDSFKIYFKEGHVYTGSSDLNNYGVHSQYSDLVNDIADEYNISTSEARNMLADSSMFQQLADALEDGDDPVNSSHAVSGTSDEDYFNTDHWYDEQTSVLCVRKYVTYVSVGDIALSDKLDITTGDDNRTDTLKQSGNRNDLFSSAMYGKWYVSMYLKNDADLSDNEKADDTQYQVLWQEKPVQDSDFMISDATTNDMRN